MIRRRRFDSFISLKWGCGFECGCGCGTVANRKQDPHPRSHPERAMNSVGICVAVGLVFYLSPAHARTHTPKNKYQYLDKRLLNLVSNPHHNIIDQITGIAHNIAL